eukprot:g829.t1
MNSGNYPIYARDVGANHFCRNETFPEDVTKGDGLLVELYPSFPPAENTSNNDLQKIYATVGKAVVRLFFVGRYASESNASKRLGSTHKDDYPLIWLTKANGLCPCGYTQDRVLRLLTPECSKYVLESGEYKLYKTSTAVYIDPDNAAQMWKELPHWNITVHRKDCVFFRHDMCVHLVSNSSLKENWSIAMRFTGSGIGKWLLDWFIDAKNKPVLFFKKWSAKLYIRSMYEGAEERGSGGFAGSSLFQLNVESAQTLVDDYFTSNGTAIGDACRAAKKVVKENSFWCILMILVYFTYHLKALKAEHQLEVASYRQAIEYNSQRLRTWRHIAQNTLLENGTVSADPELWLSRSTLSRVPLYIRKSPEKWKSFKEFYNMCEQAPGLPHDFCRNHIEAIAYAHDFHPYGLIFSDSDFEFFS